MTRNAQAWVTLACGTSLECDLIDRSPHGARMSVDRLASLPAEFYVSFIPHETPRPARLVWRKDRMIGIAF